MKLYYWVFSISRWHTANLRFLILVFLFHVISDCCMKRKQAKTQRYYILNLNVSEWNIIEAADPGSGVSRFIRSINSVHLKNDIYLYNFFPLRRLTILTGECKPVLDERRWVGNWSDILCFDFDALRSKRQPRINNLGLAGYFITNYACEQKVSCQRKVLGICINFTCVTRTSVIWNQSLETQINDSEKSLLIPRDLVKFN